jgi:hypothetical protein
MQNYYGMERAIEERTREARALAELQALRRRAVTRRRAERRGVFGWLRRLSAQGRRSALPAREAR